MVFASFKLNWFHQTPGMFSIIGFWLRCRVHPKNDISTWIKLSFPFLDQLIISDHEVPATCIHGAAFIWDDLVWATTSLGNAWHHGFTNISVFDKNGINAQCRRCLLCIGRHVLMSEQCSERILLGHHLATTWPPPHPGNPRNRYTPHLDMASTVDPTT